MLMIVVLPAPLGARMPKELPSSTLNEARSRITLRVLPVQKDLLTFSNAIIGLLSVLASCSQFGPRYVELVNTIPPRPYYWPLLSIYEHSGSIMSVLRTSGKVIGGSAYSIGGLLAGRGATEEKAQARPID